MDFKSNYTLVPPPTSLNKTFKAIFLLILSIFTFSFFSCDGGLFESPDDGIIIRAYDADSWQDTGILYANRGRSIFRTPNESGSENYTYKINLARGKRVYTKTVGSGTVVVMENIPVGPWKITCRAYRLDGSIEYMGSVDVEIVADETTAATVELRKCPVVKFMDDDGNVIASQTVEFGATVTKPSRPTKDGFVFTGWNKADGSKFDFNTAINENLTLFARMVWTPENFAYVEGGTFHMGSPKFNNATVHEVTVNSFLMCDHEVTQEEYLAIITGDNPSWFKGDGNLKKPVEQINWYKAVEYCNALSASEYLEQCYTIDKNTQDPNNTCSFDNLKWTVTCNFNANGYRLPTEAEWEYAARGGIESHGYTYSGSNNADEVAWLWDQNYETTHEVKTKQPNELGIYDMSGNVYEWCWDWYGNYPTTAQTNPTGSSTSSEGRVLRGSVWKSDPSITYRFPQPSNNQGINMGFRVVRSVGE